HVCRNGESNALEAAVAAQDCGVDTDQASIDVDERATRITRVDGSIRLDEVLIAFDVGEDANAAALRADDAACNRFADTERIPDRKDTVADLDLRGVGKRDGGQVVRVDLYDR